MPVHRGEIVRKKLKDFKISPTDVAIKLEIDQSTIFRWLGQKQLSLDKIFRISQASGIDFKSDFPEIEAILTRDQMELNVDYKQKYFDLVEKYAVLQEKVIAYGFGTDSGQEEEEKH